MKLSKTAIVQAFSMSDVPGVISIKRFSASKIRVRRFSDDGEVISDKVVEDPELETEGTEDLVNEVPAKDVAVFSDEGKGTDEIIAEVDGGDATPVLEAKAEEGYKEDDEAKEEDKEEKKDEEPKDPEGDDDSTAKAFSRRYSYN
jgi:ribosomal protein L12E/L44/L45/RPP1/RPP2